MGHGEEKLKFAVGDKVAILGHDRIPRAAKVTRVLTAFLQLDDNSRWATDGRRRYPKPDSFGFGREYLRPMTPELARRAAVENARALLGRTRWIHVDEAKCLALVALLEDGE